jgi:hypothetical protein
MQTSSRSSQSHGSSSPIDVGESVGESNGGSSSEVWYDGLDIWDEAEPEAASPSAPLLPSFEDLQEMPCVPEQDVAAPVAMPLLQLFTQHLDFKSIPALGFKMMTGDVIDLATKGTGVSTAGQRRARDTYERQQPPSEQQTPSAEQQEPPAKRPEPSAKRPSLLESFLPNIPLPALATSASSSAWTTARVQPPPQAASESKSAPSGSISMPPSLPASPPPALPGTLGSTMLLRLPTRLPGLLRRPEVHASMVALAYVLAAFDFRSLSFDAHATPWFWQGAVMILLLVLLLWTAGLQFAMRMTCVALALFPITLHVRASTLPADEIAANLEKNARHLGGLLLFTVSMGCLIGSQPEEILSARFKLVALGTLATLRESALAIMASRTQMYSEVAWLALADVIMCASVCTSMRLRLSKWKIRASVSDGKLSAASMNVAMAA